MFNCYSHCRCYCGEYKNNHYDTGEVTLVPTKWSEETHIQCFRPTNAFGLVEFLTEFATNKRPTEYVRISDEDKLEDVMKLMAQYWHILKPSKPSLCISVIGGAKNFVLEGRKKEVFNRVPATLSRKGLIQAAITTEALIVTSGLNIGIVRMVGDALQEGQSFHFDRRRLSNQLRCLGIAPWGYVLNREELISDNFNLPVPYKVSTVIATGRPVSLNQNHTHYIFVDEGRRMRYGGSESAKFRARLCKKIAQPWKSGGWSIPVVLVVVEGGHDVFIDARDCIREHVPVVICSGTGRAADILSMASVYRLKHQEKEFKDFHAEEKLMLRRKLVPVSGAKKVKEAIEMIAEIVHDPKLITTFDMNKSDDLDLAILYSLIKTNSCLTTQLKLAFTWDRSDIAEEKIFQQGARVDPETLEPTMMDALLQDKTEFVRILLQNGVAMRQFLTLERIHRLYNESKNREGLKKFLIHKRLLESQETIRAISTANLIVKENTDVASNNNNNNNNNNNTIEQQAVDISENYSSSVYLSTISKLAKKTIGRFAHHVYELDTPELFLWAVLHQRQAMAMFFWEHSEDALTLSLIACVLYQEMVKALPNYDSETADLYGGYIDAFENLAIKVLDECNSVDPDTTLYLIESETPLWGGYNCLNLADKATRRKFISSVACQNSLNFAWSHGIQASTGSLLLTLFCPIILLSKTFLKFQDKRTSFAVERQNSIEEDEDMKAISYDYDFVDREEQVATPSTLKQRDSSRLSNFTNSSYSPGIPLKKKLVIFYTAPKVKFFLQTFAYIIFLLFFSFVLLFRVHQTTITGEEAAVMMYLICYILDVIRQICVVPGSGKQKLKLWVKTYAWVYIDDRTNNYFYLGEIILRGNTIFIICYIRIFRLYGFHPALGPKLVMIQRMLTELLIFIFIMVVILVSYGVAVQALLYPNQTEFDWNTVRDALYYPYWNLYGELNLEYSFAINSSCTGVPDGVVCPTYNFVAPLLLAFYLLLAGILLINLVIAMFSNVFQQVEYNSILLWKFSMYALVVEYNKRPVMPVPLSALQAIVELFQYLTTRCKRERIRRHGSQSVSKTATQVHVFVNCGSADESHPTQQTSKPQNSELKSTLKYEPYEDVQNDDGTELFGFLSMKSRRASAARDLLSGNSAILGNLDLLRKFASATAITEADEEMRIARLFETNCMHNFLKKQKLETEKTVNAGISNIKSRVEKLHRQVYDLADQVELAMREMETKVGLLLGGERSSKTDKNPITVNVKPTVSKFQDDKHTAQNPQLISNNQVQPSVESVESIIARKKPDQYHQHLEVFPVSERLNLLENSMERLINRMDKPREDRDAQNESHEG
ncbi:hypothetical protein EG68_05898 [Paragonimus skrjabini miyazakii]|uniref:Transient receptor potential cation channel subfamily M member 3 n=1 Tax=Paragonimus skrjabini miyazakii TaxID=59628 RepID=A0A8S9YUM7_9TREM|nr:hypothetical protein EG68_05898 [Paragonimus skrjabini miyazakii]